MSNLFQPIVKKPNLRVTCLTTGQPHIEQRIKCRTQHQTPRPTVGGRLQGRVALITGGDSGIGRAVALAFAREGATVAIGYLEEHEGARRTAGRVEADGPECLLLQFDVSSKQKCDQAVEEVITRFGKLDILVNNAAEQHVTEDQTASSFRTNLFSMFFLTAAALPHLEKSRHGAIINTTSAATCHDGRDLRQDSTTQGAIVSFTRSLAGQLADKKIRVNGVAPGPVPAPPMASTVWPARAAAIGSDRTPGHPGHASESAECYVYLASSDAHDMTGKVLQSTGGEILHG